MGCNGGQAKRQSLDPHLRPFLHSLSESQSPSSSPHFNDSLEDLQQEGAPLQPIY